MLLESLWMGLGLFGAMAPLLSQQMYTDLCLGAMNCARVWGESGEQKGITEALPLGSFHSRSQSHFHAKKCTVASRGTCCGREVRRRLCLTGKL